MTAHPDRSPFVAVRATFVAFIAAVLVVPNSFAQAQAQRPAQAPAAAPAQPSASAGAQQANPITASLMRAGVKRCAPQIQKVTDFLNRGARVATVPFPAAANTDDSLISLSSEVQMGNVLSYSDANFAPRADGGCSAVYEQITHWQNTCDQVYAAQFPTFQSRGLLGQQVRVYYNNPGSQVMLVPAGPGCVVIKKEIIH